MLVQGYMISAIPLSASLEMSVSLWNHRDPLAKQFPDIFNTLHLLLLITHHAQRARTIPSSQYALTRDVQTGASEYSHELLPLLDLQHFLLDTTLNNEPHNLDFIRLAHSMDSINSLRFDCETPPRVHHVNFFRTR